MPRTDPPWTRWVTAGSAAVVLAALALVGVAAVRDADGGEPSLSSPELSLVGEAPVAQTPPPVPTPTPEALVATAPDADAGNPADPVIAGATEVVLVGDSLAEGATPMLATILDSAGVPLRVDASSGRGTAAGARALGAMGVQPGGVVVVILGTNDTEDRAEAVRNVTAVVDAVPPGTPIRWIDVARSDADVINEVIAAVAAIDPDVEMLAWSAVVADNPDLLVADRIHFTGEGYAALAAFIASEALEMSLPS